MKLSYDVILHLMHAITTANGLVWGSAAAWRFFRHSPLTRWTEWTLAMTSWSWWQHY